MSTNRKTPPFSAEKPDKSGAHSIAALNRFICDSKNGATYSNNIKASIGEKPDPVNPYIPQKTRKPLPDEKFTVKNNACNCGIRSRRPLTDSPAASREGFCGCGEVFMRHSKEISDYGPIALVILILVAALLLAKIVICRLSRRSANVSVGPVGMAGGAVDADFESII